MAPIIMIFFPSNLLCWSSCHACLVKMTACSARTIATRWSGRHGRLKLAIPLPMGQVSVRGARGPIVPEMHGSVKETDREQGTTPRWLHRCTPSFKN